MQVQSNHSNSNEISGNKNTGNNNMDTAVGMEDNDPSVLQQIVNTQDQDQILNSEEDVDIDDTPVADDSEENKDEKQQETDDENLDEEDAEEDENSPEKEIPKMAGLSSHKIPG